MTPSARLAKPRQRTADLADVERLAEVLARLTRSTRRELQLPLGASTIGALATLADHGPMRMGDLAEREGVRPSTLSRMVAALEDAGYAIRQPDPADRRSVVLQATDEGRAVLAAIRGARSEVLATRVAALSPSQQRALVRALPALELIAQA